LLRGINDRWHDTNSVGASTIVSLGSGRCWAEYLAAAMLNVE
jgi:hypothetical protein